MVKVVIISKTGELTNANMVSEDMLYKKVGFKKADGFERRHSWQVKVNGETCEAIVYARNTGRAGMENKSELPPPIDSDLYFGKIGIVLKGKDKLQDLSVEEWERIYNKLYGGFEDLSKLVKEDEEEEDELDEYPDEMKTVDGYLKDDFVVSDDELEEEEYVFSEEEV
jgi:hypothetical protein